MSNSIIPVKINSNACGSWEEAILKLRSQPNQQKLVFDAYYDDPLIDSAKRYWRSEEWLAIRDLLPESGEVLDVGAGRGIASYALAQDGFKVTALEPDDGDIVGTGVIHRLFCDAGLPITVVNGFSENLPFADASFDVVFVRAVLHHTVSLETACKEFARVLRPGGRVLALREHVISNLYDKKIFLDMHPLHQLYGGENAFLLSDYQNALEQAGLHLLQVFDPFSSPINFAPHSLQELKYAIAGRVGRFFPVLIPIIATALSVTLFWKLLHSILVAIDNRPGRLYSFVAIK